MKKCLRPLYGKMNTDKLTSKEWDIIGKRISEYASNTSTFGWIAGFIAGLIVGAIVGFLN